MSAFVTRTITKDGTVKIGGKIYVPTEPLLDHHYGMRAIYGTYRGLVDVVSLWGCDDEEWPGPFCHEGVFKWEWWRAALGEDSDA